eukprot:jgi/Chrpa1/17122/Chrysochromulina_OHIO_Genome00023386-RA
MATAPRRGSGSGEGASLTASVAALLRVPGGAEVRGFGVRERLMALTVHARHYARCAALEAEDSVPVPLVS